jgi:hypothetical protein
VIIFILDCVLVSDLLYAYKPKYKDIMSPEGIAYFGIGHYSVPPINYDSTQHPSGLYSLKNQVRISEQAKHYGLDVIRFKHIWGVNIHLRGP